MTMSGEKVHTRDDDSTRKNQKKQITKMAGASASQSHLGYGQMIAKSMLPMLIMMSRWVDDNFNQDYLDHSY